MPTSEKAKNVKIGGEKNISFYTKFAKVDDEQRMVFGYCTTEAVDSQGEIVSKDAIRRAWDKYMEYGNIREMHQPSAVGVTKEYSHDDFGTYIGVKVVDDSAWKKVKEEVYKGFSIGGRVVKQTDNVIDELILSEISLVDRPANPDAKIMVVKVDDGLVKSSALEAVTKINILMKKFVEIDGIKYAEDPANPGQALLENGEKVLYVEPVEETQEEVAEDEETAVVADAAVEETTEETQEESTEATEETAEVATEETADATASEAEKQDVAVGIKKDTDGILTMANVLYDLEWAIACFASDGKDVTTLESAKALIMEVVASEASTKETADNNQGLNKADLGSLEKTIGSMFEKAFAPVKAELEAVKSDIAVIKNTKVSKRPTTSVAVEKGFEGDNGNSVDLAKSELTAVEQEINKFADEMNAALATNPGRRAEFEKKANELHTKLEGAKQKVRTAMQG